MTITGSDRMFAGGCGLTGASITYDSTPTLGGVNLVEASSSPISTGANSTLRYHYLGEASFPAGSTADAVFDTSLTTSDPVGSAGVWAGVEDAGPDTQSEYQNANSDTFTVSGTPGAATGLAVGIAARQWGSADSYTNTGDLAEQQSVERAFEQSMALADELDPTTASRTFSGDWGAATRDNADVLLIWDDGAAGGGAVQESRLLMLGVGT